MRITYVIHTYISAFNISNIPISSFFFATLHWIPTSNDGGRVPGKPQLFKKQLNFIILLYTRHYNPLLI